MHSQVGGVRGFAIEFYSTSFAIENLMTLSVAQDAAVAVISKNGGRQVVAGVHIAIPAQFHGHCLTLVCLLCGSLTTPQCCTPPPIPCV